MFLAKGRRKRKDGSYYCYYVLREAYWDKGERRQKQRHLAYVGTKRTISLDRARKLAKKLGITVEDLRRVRRLKIEE